MGESGNRRWVWAVLVVALVLRLGWALSRGDIGEGLPDQREYLELGRSVLAGDGLRMYDPRFGEWVVAYRMPGYPLLIAACGGSTTAVRVVQAMIDTATVGAVMLLARRWGGRPLAAGAMAAVNPIAIYFSGLVLSETLFAGMLTWALLLLSGRGTWRFVAGVALAALAVMVRPGAVGLPVVLAAAAVVCGVRPRGPALLIAAVVTAAVLTPWAWRNWVRLDAWVWTTTNAGITRYDGFHPDATGASDQSFVAAMPYLRDLHEVGRDQFLAARADEFAARDPARAARLAAIKVARTWSPVPLSESYRGWAYQLAAAAYAGPLFVLAGWAVWRGRAGGRALLLAPAAYVTVAAALSVGSLRYRMPAEPALVVLASAVPRGVGGRTMSRE